MVDPLRSVERAMGVFMMSKGPDADLARRALEATPATTSRSVMDLDRTEILGVANPPQAFVRMEGERQLHVSYDEFRRWLEPASLAELGRAMLRARELREAESFEYALDYRPPNCDPFRMRLCVSPLLLDSSGRAHVVVSDVSLEFLP